MTSKNIIDPQHAAAIIESQYKRLATDCAYSAAETPFNADALRTIALALLDIDRHLAGIDNSPKAPKVRDR